MTPTNFFFSFLALALHEAAHIGAAHSFGIKIKRIGVSWKGPFIVREAGPPSANIMISLAGPLMNILLALAWPVSPAFALINLVLGLSNLVPFWGSDGQRVWNLLRQQAQATLSV